MGGVGELRVVGVFQRSMELVGFASSLLSDPDWLVLGYLVNIKERPIGFVMTSSVL